jgi:hypothetical protein
MNFREFRRGNQRRTNQRNWQQDEGKQTQAQHNMCWKHRYAQTNTNNINKT